MSRQVDAQCWLEEHRALRSTIELHFTSMRYMVMLNITAIGIIAGLVLANTGEKWLLLIIPIFSSVIGSLVYFHSRRMSQLGHYIEDRIAPKLVSLAGDSEVMGWESYVRGEEEGRNKFARWFSISGLSLLSFVIFNILALGFIAKDSFTKGICWPITLWSIGLVLTVILIIASIDERKFWFRKQESTV